MDTSTEPATQQQLVFLEQHGYSPSGPLTRVEAAELIRKLREGQIGHIVGPSGATDVDPAQAYHLGLARVLSGGGQGGGPASLRLQPTSPLFSKRQEFWLDTCREVTQMHIASTQVYDLYKVHGCRFSLPTNEEVQEVLDALDTAMPEWETTHPELFYSTLELNFPELVNRKM